MPVYNVHLYREMRLFFPGITAPTHEAAAQLTAHKQDSEAEDIDECDGETLAALVDVAGDEHFDHSRVIDFDPVRAAAPELLEALEGALFVLDPNVDGSGPSRREAIANIRAAIAKARAKPA